MKHLIFSIVLIFFALACKDSGTTDESTKIITSNYWKLDRFTDISGRTLSQNELNSQAQGIFGFDFEFRDDNVTRGRDRVTKQIVNAGTWYLKSENKILDIQIIGFGGEFKVLELSKSKLVLQAENNKFISVGSTINLELVPSL